MAEVTDFIDQVLSQDFSKASPTFSDLIGSKMTDALEAERINVAADIFNSAEDREAEDQYELDLGDDEYVDGEIDGELDQDEDEDDFDDDELEDGAEEALDDED